MKNSVLALALFAAALPFAASAADGVNYNYVEGGYLSSNIDGPDADGWALKGSVAIAPNFHLFGEYSKQDIDHSRLDYNQWRAGVGYNLQISPNADLVARAAYEKFDADWYDTHGYSAEVGVQGSLVPNLTGYALAGYEDGHDYDGDFYGRLGAQYKFTRNWSASADVKFADGDTQWFVGPRLSW
ncbi:MAG: diffusible signal factor-reguated Ax21 family protein [Pseudoxanthomonas sp.]